MGQKRGNNVKPPVAGKKGGEVGSTQNPDQNLTEQNQMEDAGPPTTGQKANIGQHMGRGRPPLMKK